MARKSKEQIKKDKEVSWFIRKYLWNDENMRSFVHQLSPHTIGTIVKQAMSMGMCFTWDDNDMEEELELQKMSVFDLMKLKEKTKC